MRHRQAADVQRAQSDALDEGRDGLLGLRIVAGEEDVGPAVLQDAAEDRVEGLHDAGAGRGDLGDLLRDRGLPAVGESVERGVEGVADVDDDLAGECVAVLGDDRNDAVVQQGRDDDVAGGDGAPRAGRRAAAQGRRPGRRPWPDRGP